MLNYFPLFRLMPWIADNSLSDYSVACMHWSSLPEEMLLSFCSFFSPDLHKRKRNLFSQSYMHFAFFPNMTSTRKPAFENTLTIQFLYFCLLFRYSYDHVMLADCSKTFQTLHSGWVHSNHPFRRSNRLSKPLEISKDLHQSETDPRRWPIVRVLVR